MIPSKYQINFWDAVQNTNNNILLRACPGSGKTYTSVKALKRIPRHKRTLFCAFSKNIQLELESRVPNHVDCSTLHSLGFKALYGHFRAKMKVDSWKTFKFSDELVNGLKSKDGSKLSKKDQFSYKFTLSDLIDMARINLDTSLEGFKNVEKNHDIICKNGEVKNAIQIFDKLSSYNRQKGEEKIIDYVDMIHLPIHLNISLPKYDYIILDEAQDMNPNQMELLFRMLKPNGRFIAAGESLQSIFSFQGAMTNSMDILKSKFNMKEYPLSVTYRVPKKGVELLKKINPQIECPDNAIDGEIRNGSLEEVREGDLVICRNTKPLITAYFLLLSLEKKSTIVGKEMEKGLLKLVDKYEGIPAKGIRYKIEQELKELEEQLASDGIDEPRKHYKYLSYEEKTDILLIFVDRYGINAKKKIQEVFHEDKDSIRLMTVHKSKGLESDRVFFITHYDNQKLIPSKYAKTDEQKQQERNLEYVALSRFRKEMVFVKL